MPDETAGPLPGDGSNGPNVLSESGIVRTDIRSSFGSSSGAAVYVWHCDREGGYPLDAERATDQNDLRGVQETDGTGA